MQAPIDDPAVIGALIGVAFGTALPWPLKTLWRILRGSPEREAAAAEADAKRDGEMIQRLLDRAHDVETMLEVLRKALDKNLVRENAVVTAAELLLGIVELIDKPTLAMKTMRLRAIEILALARRMNGGQT
jgi:hypothetical protein